VTKQTVTRPAAQGMTHDEVLALPVMVSLDVSNRAIGCGRTTGFRLARLGQYPVAVHRLGGQYRVARADLLRFLGIEDTPRRDAA
jgi:hypothetical protein